jgi:hypothetical protein
VAAEPEEKKDAAEEKAAEPAPVPPVSGGASQQGPQ